MMDAIVLPRPGEPLQAARIPVPEPGHGQVRVSVSSTSVCYRDLLDAAGAFPFIRENMVLGHEIAGVVDAVGEGVSSLRVGDRVVSLHWAPCGQCSACLHGRTPECTNAEESFLALTTPGGYAEHLVQGTSGWVRVPDRVADWLPAGEAATVMGTFGTVWHGMVVRGAVQPGERVVITGASGGVGSAAVLLARAMGCEVAVVTSSPDKVPFLRSILGSGAPAESIIVADGPEDRWSRRVSRAFGGAPADLILDAVGAPTFTQGLRALRPGGRVVLVGNVSNGVGELPLGLAIVRSLSVIGSDSISPGELLDCMEFMRANGLFPRVERRLALHEAPFAHDLLRDRKVSGRVVLDIDPGRWAARA